jgi:putative membrane protein insertion efficiency factor
MGHRDSSATLSGGVAVRATRSGIAGSSAERAPEPAAESIAGAAPLDVALARPSWKARILLGLIGAYQGAISPLTFSPCKFHPTCSRYAAEAIRTHGARRGAWLALRRLGRCHPFGPGGFDPVPDRLDDTESHPASDADEARS